MPTSNEWTDWPPTSVPEWVETLGFVTKRDDNYHWEGNLITRAGNLIRLAVPKPVLIWNGVLVALWGVPHPTSLVGTSGTPIWRQPDEVYNSLEPLQALAIIFEMMDRAAITPGGNT